MLFSWFDRGEFEKKKKSGVKYAVERGKFEKKKRKFLGR
jgi:hypothetical protein